MEKYEVNRLLASVLLGISLVIGVTSVSAATTSSLTLNIDWDSLIITSSTGDVTAGAITGAEISLNGVVSVEEGDGSPVTVSDNVAGTLTATASVSGTRDGYNNVTLSSSNDATGTNQSATGVAYKELEFTSGAVGGERTFSIEYSVDLKTFSDLVPSYSSAEYELLFVLGDLGAYDVAYDTAYNTAYDTAFNNNSGNEDAAKKAGEAAGEAAGEPAANIHGEELKGSIECSGDCLETKILKGTLEFTTTLNGDNKYWLEGQATGSIYTDTAVSAVPVPAAVWLFGSGLLGLIGFSKRKKAA